MLGNDNRRLTQRLVRLSPARRVAGGGRARHGGAAKQLCGRVPLAAGGGLPLPAVDALVRQGSLQGASARSRTWEQGLRWGGEGGGQQRVRTGRARRDLKKQQKKKTQCFCWFDGSSSLLSSTFSSLVVGGGLSSVISFFRSSSKLDLAVCRWGDWEPRRLARSCGWPPSRPSLWCLLGGSAGNSRGGRRSHSSTQQQGTAVKDARCSLFFFCSRVFVISSTCCGRSRGTIWIDEPHSANHKVPP